MAATGTNASIAPFHAREARQVIAGTTGAQEMDGLQIRHTKLNLADGQVDVSLIVRGRSVRLVEVIHAMCRNGMYNMLAPFEDQY